MAELKDLVAHADRLLDTQAFKDYCPNGLQVEGAAKVKKILSAVTASQAAIDAAIKASADVLLVHHGYFWHGEEQRITGMKRARIKALLEHGISLLAYHLPLDAHEELGNNAQLARLLGLKVEGRFGPGRGNTRVGFHGQLSSPMSASALASHIGAATGRVPLHVDGGKPVITRVAWCTGAAQSFIDEAASLGVDAYLSGEISEQTTHVARECGIHYFALGHHVSERYGVQALGQHLAANFDVAHQFVDIDNPA